MEKHHSRSSAKRMPTVSDDAYISSLIFGKSVDMQPAIAPKEPLPASAPEQSATTKAKVSRKDVSRCINIWASMYFGDDRQQDTGDLRLPSRPWLGRSSNSLKRFE